MHTADQSTIRKHNQKIILEEIIANSPISRAKLSKITHLNKATISSQISLLSDKKIIFEIGPGQSSGGRKPVLLVFNKIAGFVIGVDLGINYILTLLTDLEGNIVFQDFHEITDPDFKHIQPILVERIQFVSKQASESPYGIIGIGVGIHGFVNQDQLVVFTPNSKWSNVDLKGFLKNYFDCPIFIENEANAGAYGEKLFGALKKYKDSIYISVGIGIGIGILINNDLYRGMEGFSGEMGHMTIDLNGKKCRCGNRGCWELYASEEAFLSELSKLKQVNRLHVEEAIKLIESNDIETLHLFQKFSYYLGVGITNIINTFNPEAVVLKGNLINIYPLVINTIRSFVTSRTYTHTNNQCVITVSELNRQATALGAASFIIKDFLARIDSLESSS